MGNQETLTIVWPITVFDTMQTRSLLQIGETLLWSQLDRALHARGI